MDYEKVSDVKFYSELLNFVKASFFLKRMNYNILPCTWILKANPFSPGSSVLIFTAV